MNAQIVTVNLIPELSAPAVVRVSQYDVGRPLVFRVMDGMSMATLPQYWSAKVEGTKPSGLGFSETCTISGSTVTVSTTEAMTQEAGQIHAEISLTYTGVVIGTANFILAVEKTPHAEGTTDGTQETMANLETRLQGQIDGLDSRIDAIEGDQSIVDELDALDTRVTALEQGSGSGLTGDVKTALLSCFGHVAWADANGQIYYNELRNALGYVPVTGISLSSVAGNIYTGHTVTIAATISPSNATDKNIIWTSSDPSVATVSANGTTATINGVSDGSAIITATTNDGGFIATFTATVATAVPTNVTLDKSSMSETVGKTFLLTATVTPNEAADKTLTWTSSDTSLVTVTPSADTMSCTVACVGVGAATVTARTNVGNVSATCSVTSMAEELNPITPTLRVCSSSGKFEYAYYGATEAEIDTTDPTTIQNQSKWGRGALVFDCRGKERVRIECYVNQQSYTNTNVQVYAFNQDPSYDFNYVGDMSTSGTTDAGYPIVSSVAAGYKTVGTYFNVTDFEIGDYPYIVLCGPWNNTAARNVTAGEDSTLSDYTMATDTYSSNSRLVGFRISEIV